MYTYRYIGIYHVLALPFQSWMQNICDYTLELIAFVFFFFRFNPCVNTRHNIVRNPIQFKCALTPTVLRQTQRGRINKMVFFSSAFNGKRANLKPTDWKSRNNCLFSLNNSVINGHEVNLHGIFRDKKIFLFFFFFNRVATNFPYVQLHSKIDLVKAHGYYKHNGYAVVDDKSVKIINNKNTKILNY